MKEYRFTLTDGSTTEVLTKNPAGWNKIGLTLMRNSTYKSVLRNMTLPFRFVNKAGSGYAFILSDYDTNGIYGNMTVTIEKRNPDTNWYEFFYSGKIDYKPTKFTIDRGVFIECSLLDNARLEKLKAREDTELNLFNLVSPDGVTVTDFAALRTINLTDIPIVLQADIMATAHNVNQTVNQATTASYAFLNTPTVNKNQIGDAVVIDGSEIIYTNNHPDSIRLQASIDAYWNFYGKIYNPTGLNRHTRLDFKITLKANDSGGTVLDTVTYVLQSEAQNLTTDKAFNISGDFVYHSIDLTLPTGGYLEFVSTVNFITDSGSTHSALVSHFHAAHHIFITENLIGIGTTTTPGLFIHEAFTRLIQLITSETDTSKLFYSTHLGRTTSEFTPYAGNGEFSGDFLFSGKMCRNYPNQPLNISLKKLVQQVYAMYNLGFGYDPINDRFYVDTMDKFYDGTYLMFDLGEVSKFKRTPMSEGYFSQIKAGYDYDGDYEDFNGAFEFNLGKEYSTPAPVKDEKDLVAPYRADSVGIELTRQKQFIETESIDTNGDSAIFIVRTDGTNPVVSALPFLADGFVGIGKYYNTMVTPRQNMLRHGNTIISTLYKNTSPIKYVKSSKELSVDIYSDVSTFKNDNSDIAKTELGIALFIPEKYNFESHLTPAQIAITLASCHGYISFSYDGINYEGFVDKIELGDYNKKATFELIAKNIVTLDEFMFEDDVQYQFEDGVNKEFEQ